MSKLLKVFVVNYDGRTERMVAATSQKAAAELMRTTLSSLRHYGHTGASARLGLVHDESRKNALAAAARAYFIAFGARHD